MAKKRYALRTVKYNFRLDPNDPRENEVINIIESLRAPDVGIREIVTDAILAFKGKRVSEQAPERVMLRQLRGTIKEFHDLLEEARSFYASSPQGTPEYQQHEESLRHRLAGAVQGMISPPRVYEED